MQTILGPPWPAYLWRKLFGGIMESKVNELAKKMVRKLVGTSWLSKTPSYHGSSFEYPWK